MSELTDLISRILADGVQSEEEHDQFIEMVYGDGELDEEESKQVSEIFRLIQEGKLVVSNKARDGSDSDA